MTFPLIHMNGSGEKNLQCDNDRIVDAMREVLKTMVWAVPNGRDYADQSSYEQARDEHYTRMQAVATVSNAYERIAEYLYAEPEDRELMRKDEQK